MLVVLGLLIGAITLAVLPVGEADAKPPCRPPGATTVAATALVRVLDVPDRGLFACNVRNRRLRFLGDNDDVLNPRIEGPYLGFEGYASSSGGQTSEVEVLDTRTGRSPYRIVQRNASQRGPVPPDDRNEDLFDLVLAPSGRPFWIASVTTYLACPEDPLRVCSNRTTREVRRATGRTRYRTLDSGPNIIARSLAERRGRVYWTKGSSRISRPLR